MNSTQQSIHQILQNKRDLFRETIRKNEMNKIFEEKRIQTQQNYDSQESLTLTSQSSIKKQKNKIKIETESQFEEEGFIGYIKIRTKVNLTPNYLYQILGYLKKGSQIYQVSRIFTLCEDAILDKNLIGSDLVPYLVEIIFKITEYKNEIPFRPIPLLFLAYTLHQDYIILQYIKMYLQKNKQEINDIDQFCKEKFVFERDNFLNIICSNLKFANLQMLLFLCETIQDHEFIQAIKFYAEDIFNTKIEHKKEYEKTIKKIQQLAEIRLSVNEFHFQKR